MQEEGESKSSGERSQLRKAPGPSHERGGVSFSPFCTILPRPLFLVPAWLPSLQAGLPGFCLPALPKPPCLPSTSRPALAGRFLFQMPLL